MFRPGPIALLLLTAGLALSSCASDEDRQYACPEVLILRDADTLVRFRPGPGRDITDVEYEARIANFVGDCDYTDEGVEIDLRVAIGIERGPASRDPAIDLEYFVALPDFAPQPEGKRILRVRGRFEENRPRLVYQDDVELFIPLESNANGPDREIILGFQLTEEELAYNRSQRAR